MRFYILRTSCIIPFFRLRSGLVSFSGLCIFLQCSLPSYPHEFPKKAFNFVTHHPGVICSAMSIEFCAREKQIYVLCNKSVSSASSIFHVPFIFRLQSLFFLCNFHYQLSYRRPWIHSFEEKIHFKAKLTQYFIY